MKLRTVRVDGKIKRQHNDVFVTDAGIDALASALSQAIEVADCLAARIRHGWARGHIWDQTRRISSVAERCSGLEREPPNVIKRFGPRYVMLTMPDASSARTLKYRLHGRG